MSERPPIPYEQMQLMLQSLLEDRVSRTRTGRRANFLFTNWLSRKAA